MVTTTVLKFCVHTVDDGQKFIVRLEAPTESLPSISGDYQKWVDDTSDRIREIFAPSAASVYLMIEPSPDEKSMIGMRLTFDQIRSDLVDSNIRLSKIEAAAREVISAWQNGDLASAVNSLRATLAGS